MIHKLQLKFVAICMVLISLVLGGVFLAIYSSAERSVETTSREVLQRVLQQEDLAVRPGPAAPGSVQLPYFTVSVWAKSGGAYTAYVTGGTYPDLDRTEDLQEILRDCLAQNAQEGVVEPYQLRYLRQELGLYTRLAFVDMSVESATLHHLTRSYLQIAAVSVVLLLGISMLLSRWATAPVERAWKQQKQFLADASHELKTPLTVILSNAELLARQELDSRPARWADNIQTEAGRMRRLVEQMLTLARADQAAEPSVSLPVSLSDVAADCALSFEPVAFESGRFLRYTIPPEVYVWGDPEKLHQLLSILLDNAIKYGAEGGTITLRLQTTERQAQLLISNPGTPIPPEQLRHLFERFYRADVSRGEQSGFGLGLSIAASIAQEHKGSLRAESDETSTRFLLTLPLKRP